MLIKHSSNRIAVLPLYPIGGLWMSNRLLNQIVAVCILTDRALYEGVLDKCFNEFCVGDSCMHVFQVAQA